MKRLIKKANQELNQMIIDFLNKDIRFNNWYVFEKKGEFVNTLHEVRFYISVYFWDITDIDNVDMIKNYLKELNQEIESNQFNNIKQIVETLISQIIQSNKQIIPIKEDVINLQLMNQSSFSNIRKSFVSNYQNNYQSQSMKEKGIDGIPYVIKNQKANLEMDEFIYVQVSFCVEYQNKEEDFINQKNQTKEEAKNYMKKILHETNFVKDNFLSEKSSLISSQDIYGTIHKIYSESQWVNKGEENKQMITKHLTDGDFLQDDLKEFFIQEVIHILKTKLWNESNVVQKQMIRHFIKKFGNETM